MPEYRFIQYELLDEGTIAAITLDRPGNPQRAEPGAARRARRRVRRGRGRRPGARRDPRRRGADVLRRVTTWARRTPSAERSRGPTSTRRTAPTARTRKGAEQPHAAGVALLLPEHAAVAEPPQDHHRPGARHRVRRRADADVGVRPHRRRRRHALRRRRRHAARHVRRRVLRAPVGARAAQDEGADAHRRRARRRRGPPVGHGVEGVPRRRARDADARVRRGASRRSPR